MTNERKEPHLSDLGPADKQDRIPTLYDTIAPDLLETRRPGSPKLSIPGEETVPNLATLRNNATAEPRFENNDLVDKPVPEKPATAAPPIITAEAIEVLSDRVLDRIVPALREAIAAAVAELLNPSYRESH